MEGITSFFEPGLLIMLPIFVFYFAGGGRFGTGKAVRSAFFFLIGFSAATFAACVFDGYPLWLLRHQRFVNLISGSFITVFGLNQLGLLRWNRLPWGSRVLDAQNVTYLPTVWFGILFSALRIPCTGWHFGFPANAPVAEVASYCLGLGIPFLIISLLVYEVIISSGWVKRHYRAINLLCGCFLILSGILTASGLLGRLIRYLYC